MPRMSTSASSDRGSPPGKCTGMNVMRNRGACWPYSTIGSRFVVRLVRLRHGVVRVDDGHQAVSGAVQRTG